MNGSRQRLAWTILLGSFFICIGVAFAIPLGVGTLIQRTTRPLNLQIQANQGTVGIQQNDNGAVALFAGDPPFELNSSGLVLTNIADTALILVSPPNETSLLARMQIYGNSNLQVKAATTPRFASSTAGHRLELALNSGRLLLSVPPSEDRPLEIDLEVPQGEVTIDKPGRYSIITANVETQVAVFQGEAAISTGSDALNLSLDQRGVLPAESPVIGPLETERNLVHNGSFNFDLNDWVELASNIEFPDQPDVVTEIDATQPEPLLRITRDGIGHADIGLRQVINQDVTDFSVLRLTLSMRILHQSLGVCGQQGSECPIMVRIEYDDVNGVAQTWQQGFFAVGEISPTTPDVCVACPPPLNAHQRVPYQQLVFYESANLLDRLGQQGILPRHIKSLTLIASGHSFECEVVDVSLMAQE